MELTVGDLKVWNESLIGLIKELENLANFASQVKDQALRDVMSQQLATHRENYQALKALLGGESGSGPGHTETRFQSFPVSDREQPGHLAMTTNTGKSSDRLMAYSHFLACCRGGREFAWNLFDVTYAPLAEVLQKAFTLYAHDALAMKHWLMSHGDYLMQLATQEQIRDLIATFS